MPLVAPLLLARSCWAAIPAGDPYPPLHGGSFSAKKVAASPDPAQRSDPHPPCCLRAAACRCCWRPLLRCCRCLTQRCASYVWDLDKLTEPAAYQSISDRRAPPFPTTPPHPTVA